MTYHERDRQFRLAMSAKHGRHSPRPHAAPRSGVLKRLEIESLHLREHDADLARFYRGEEG